MISWFYWVLLGFAEFYQVLTGFYWVLLELNVFTEFYRFLLSFTEFYRVLPSFTEFYRVLPSFTEFYRILPSFTEFYKVLPSFMMVPVKVVFFCSIKDYEPVHESKRDPLGAARRYWPRRLIGGRSGPIHLQRTVHLPPCHSFYRLRFLLFCLFFSFLSFFLASSAHRITS